MKKLMLIIALVVAGSLIASANNNDNLVPVYGIENGDQVSGVGTMMLKGDIWVIRTAGSEGTDYLPSNLTKAFQVDGKAVTFEANLDEIPPGVRMAGRPVTLVSIK